MPQLHTKFLPGDFFIKTICSFIFLLFFQNVFSATTLVQVNLTDEIKRAVTEAYKIGSIQYEIGGVSTITPFENQINLTDEQIILDIIDTSNNSKLTNIINNVCPEISRYECADKIKKQESVLLIPKEFRDISTFVGLIKQHALADEYMAWIFFSDTIKDYIHNTLETGYSSYLFGYKKENIHYFTHILISPDQKKVLVFTADYRGIINTNI